MRIKFIEDRDVEAQGEIVDSFKAGEIYELSASSARRWIRRKAAVEVQGSVKPARPKSRPKRKPAVKKAASEEKALPHRDPPIISTKVPSK